MKRLITIALLAASFSAGAAPLLGAGEGREAHTKSSQQREDMRHAMMAKLTVMRQKLEGATSDIVHASKELLGIKYKWGGNNEEEGFDCSGFVVAVYERAIGLVLPRTAAEQAKATETIDKRDLIPGDLVFFNTLRRQFSHVGIYLGEGRFIHAPRAGSHVRIDNMNSSYWATRFNGARRVATAEELED